MDSQFQYFQKISIRFEFSFALLFLWLVLFTWTPAHAEKTSYLIQVGAFKELRYAINEVNKLTRAGLHVFYRHENTANQGEWFRVYVEKFSNRGEAVREAIRLKQRGLINDYTIKIIKEEEERVSKPFVKKTESRLVINKITLSQEREGTETLLIYANRFFWPSVRFFLEQEIPKLVIDINNAQSRGKILSDLTLHGDLIKVIRNPVQKKGEGVKIILALAADRTYEVTQQYDEAENVFNLIVGLKKP